MTAYYKATTADGTCMTTWIIGRAATLGTRLEHEREMLITQQRAKLLAVDMEARRDQVVRNVLNMPASER